MVPATCWLSHAPLAFRFDQFVVKSRNSTVLDVRMSDRRLHAINSKATLHVLFEGKTVLTGKFHSGTGLGLNVTENENGQHAYVQIGELNVRIFASASAKFGRKRDQDKYAHLNLDFDYLPAQIGGVFAELAGFRPMSPATRALLKHPRGGHMVTAASSALATELDQYYLPEEHAVLAASDPLATNLRQHLPGERLTAADSAFATELHQKGGLTCLCPPPAAPPPPSPPLPPLDSIICPVLSVAIAQKDVKVDADGRVPESEMQSIMMQLGHPIPLNAYHGFATLGLYPLNMTDLAGERAFSSAYQRGCPGPALCPPLMDMIGNWGGLTREQSRERLDKLLSFGDSNGVFTHVEFEAAGKWFDDNLPSPLAYEPPPIDGAETEKGDHQHALVDLLLPMFGRCGPKWRKYTILEVVTNGAMQDLEVKDHYGENLEDYDEDDLPIPCTEDKLFMTAADLEAIFRHEWPHGFKLFPREYDPDNFCCEDLFSGVSPPTPPPSPELPSPPASPPDIPRPASPPVAPLEDPDTYAGLSGFKMFNWVNADATYPDAADPFGEELGTGGCVDGSPICRGRIPASANPTHLLVKSYDEDGKWSLWEFDGSGKSEAFLKAMQKHEQVCDKVGDGGLATPIATSGHGYGCDNNCGYFSYSDGTEDEGCDAYPGSGFKPGGWNVVLNDDGHCERLPFARPRPALSALTSAAISRAGCETAFKLGAVNGAPPQPVDDFGFLRNGCGEGERRKGGAMLYREADDQQKQRQEEEEHAINNARVAQDRRDPKSLPTRLEREPRKPRAKEPSRDDLLCYAERYPDLTAAFGQDTKALLRHWSKHGMSEGRNPYCAPGHAAPEAEPEAPIDPLQGWWTRFRGFRDRQFRSEKQ